MSTIEAQYSGRCVYCDEHIEEGDEIVLFDGDWIHADHREDDDEVEAACA